MTEINSWQSLVAVFKYKPNATIEYEYRIDYDEDVIWIDMLVDDVYQPGHMIRVARDTRVPRFDDVGKDGAIEWIRDAIRELEMHEVDENIIVDGVRLFDPHAIREPVKFPA